MSRFPSKIFCHTTPKNIAGEPFCFRRLCFQNFLDNRGITSLWIVFVSECRKICGQPVNDSKKLEHPKLLCKIGDFHELRSKKFSLTSPKNIVGEFFVVSKHLGCRKYLCKRVEGGITILRRFIFCLNFLKKFVGDPSLYEKISGNERFFP